MLLLNMFPEAHLKSSSSGNIGPNYLSRMSFRSLWISLEGKIRNHTRDLSELSFIDKTPTLFGLRLSYLHSKAIVHRDVKTENMLLETNKTLKIADFGVARVEAQNPQDMTGETGTLGYMAPEVCISLSVHLEPEFPCVS